ncbi:MAG: ABC transporter permease [Candidatus Improbicoccus pseudotrichonymphae]|uniref:ABC transporter permease n=1 Tax=Candidatus Improbicoccus pseudotrichonymphae TaxID=3033792 RepID=A0AA48L131_9FIRM|nr:MAG: ABC transporter permease [Candidatus Improbicoccus pseudotrichonymphae]
MKKSYKAFSEEQILFLKKQKSRKNMILLTQISIFLIFLVFWELLSRFNFIDPFLTSSPTRIFKTLIYLYKSKQLFGNMFTTFLETFLSFIISITFSFFSAAFLWWFDIFEKISRPYISILNALPKIALGPIIIIWLGANVKSIIIIAILVSCVVSILSLISGFKNIDKNKILFMKTLRANKFQIFKKIILPMNINNIIVNLKINIGMSLIGVVSAEFLISKKGIGYFIIYGFQTFKLDLVIFGLILLIAIVLILYLIVSKVENFFKEYRQ